jgi:hypothetical protein
MLTFVLRKYVKIVKIRNLHLISQKNLILKNIYIHKL